MSQKNENTERKNKATLFLERNEIWPKYFIPILSFILSLVTLITVLNNSNIANGKRSPLFINRIIFGNPAETVTNDIALGKDFIYSIENKEEADRYQVIDFLPMLYIYIEDDDKVCIDNAFVELDYLYYGCTMTSDTSIFAFKDFQYDSSTPDEIFRTVARMWNHTSNSKRMDAYIIYKVEYEYTNISNEKEKKTFFISRKSDTVFEIQKHVLWIDRSLNDIYQQAKNKKKVYKIESLASIDKQGFDPAPDCFGDPTEKFLNKIEQECINIIKKIQDEYNLKAEYDKHFSSTE